MEVTKLLWTKLDTNVFDKTWLSFLGQHNDYGETQEITKCCS